MGISNGHCLWHCYMQRLIRARGYFGEKEKNRYRKFNSDRDILNIEWLLKSLVR